MIRKQLSHANTRAETHKQPNEQIFKAAPAAREQENSDLNNITKAAALEFAKGNFLPRETRENASCFFGA